MDLPGSTSASFRSNLDETVIIRKPSENEAQLGVGHRRSVGERTEGGISKFRSAFAGIQRPFVAARDKVKAWKDDMVAATDAKVADKNIVVRGLWSAAKMLGNFLYGAATSKVLWGVGLVALGALCPAVWGAALLVGAGLLLASYGTYENTKETYQVARAAGLGQAASGGFAVGAFLLNVAGVVGAFLTFGASAGLSAKATAALQAAVNYLGTGTHAMSSGTSALTEGVKAAAQHMAQAPLSVVGKAVAGTGLIGQPGITQVVKDWPAQSPNQPPPVVQSPSSLPQANNVRRPIPDPRQSDSANRPGGMPGPWSNYSSLASRSPKLTVEDNNSQDDQSVRQMQTTPENRHKDTQDEDAYGKWGSLDSQGPDEVPPQPQEQQGGQRKPQMHKSAWSNASELRPNSAVDPSRSQPKTDGKKRPEASRHDQVPAPSQFSKGQPPQNAKVSSKPQMRRGVWSNASELESKTQHVSSQESETSSIGSDIDDSWFDQNHQYVFPRNARQNDFRVIDQIKTEEAFAQFLDEAGEVLYYEVPKDFRDVADSVSGKLLDLKSASEDQSFEARRGLALQTMQTMFSRGNAQLREAYVALRDHPQRASLLQANPQVQKYVTNRPWINQLLQDPAREAERLRLAGSLFQMVGTTKQL